MNKTNLPIGVFDSGMGGLTILRALKRSLVQESFIYLGDTARLPYGTKSARTIQQYVLQMVKILIERQIKALVIACNTATTAALPLLQTMMPDVPILGVVFPGVAAAVSATRNKRIAVLATEMTIASQIYQQLICEQLPQARINSRACSLLVALAEEGMVENTVAEEALKYYLTGINEEDTLLLGCTHFPVFKSLLKKLLPETVIIIDSAEATAQALYVVLAQGNLFNRVDAMQTINYLVTDSISRFQQVGEIFLKESLIIEQIELVEPSTSA